MSEDHVVGLKMFKTGLPVLDDLLMSGLPTGTLIQIYGEKGSGKTLFAMQLAYEYLRNERRNVLYLGSELGFDKAVKAFWYTPFNERFGINPQLCGVIVERFAAKGKAHKVREREIQIALEAALREIGIEGTDIQLDAAARVFLPEYKLLTDSKEKEDEGSKIFVLKEGPLKEILALHGVKIEIVVSGGRVEVRMQPGTVQEISLTPLGGFMEENDVGMIIYDSLTSPMKETFTMTQDLPARASSINLWLGQTEQLCNRYDVTALVINHESVDPLKHRRYPYAATTLGYRTKFILHLLRISDPGSKAAHEGCLNPDLKGANRVIRLARHPRRADYENCVLLKIDEMGFHC